MELTLRAAIVMTYTVYGTTKHTVGYKLVLVDDKLSLPKLAYISRRRNNNGSFFAK